MKIDLSPIDRRKVKNLGEVLEMNNEVLGLMSRYLTVCPDFITKELIEGITGECEITLAEAYTSLLVAACGLDVENNPRDRYLSTACLLYTSFLEFSASWCSWCKKEMPSIRQAYERFKDSVVFITIHLDDNRDKWLKDLETHAVPWYCLTDLKAWKLSLIHI